MNATGLEGRRFVFKCKSCARPIKIRMESRSAPDPAPGPAPTPAPAPDPGAGKSPGSESPRRPASPPGAARDQTVGDGRKDVDPGPRMDPDPGTGRPPARGGMLTLVMILSVLIMVASAIFYLIQAGSLSRPPAADGADAINRIARYLIVEKARAAARQCQIYLIAHPGLNEKNFNRDVGLKSLAVRKVGQSGFTFMYSVSTGKSPAKILLNPEDKMYGADLNVILRVVSRDQVKRVKKIFRSANEGKNVESAGVYLLRIKKEKPREQYMALAPVEGTNLGIVAFTFLDEFVQPEKAAEARASKSTAGMRGALIAMIAGALLFLGAVVRLTMRMERLAVAFNTRRPTSKK
ncbi:MAG: hypothetical protein GY859_21210 [Desulfobacterales bacterium]|nr:hypothetical protein [Desulfobacterales bacterium]